MSKRILEHHEWKGLIIGASNDMAKYTLVPEFRMKIAKELLKLYLEQNAIVETRRFRESFEYLKKIKFQIDDMLWDALMTRKEWEWHIHTQQDEIKKCKYSKDGLKPCQTILHKSKTLYDMEYAEVQRQLELLLQQHGRDSDRYQEKLKDSMFLSNVKEQIDNMFTDVLNWQFLSEEEDEDDENDEEHEEEYSHSVPQTLASYEASADEDSADKNDEDEEHEEEYRFCEFQTCPSYQASADETFADAAFADEAQPTPKRRKMDL